MVETQPCKSIGLGFRFLASASWQKHKLANSLASNSGVWGSASWQKHKLANSLGLEFWGLGFGVVAEIHSDMVDWRPQNISALNEI